jgi:hypothetical protein
VDTTKEETMQYSLKPLVLAVITTLGAALTIVPAHAQSRSRVLTNIPFGFSVGNTMLKAGNYTIDELQSGIISFSSEDEKQHKFALTFPGDSDKHIQEPQLVFVRYASEAFLKRVVFSSNEDCLELPESSRERELIKNRTASAELSLLFQPAH